MISTDYVIGEKIRISVVFTDANDVKTDPDVVKVEVKDPAGTVNTFEYGIDPITKTGVGEYYYDQLADTVGKWSAYWYTTGNYIAAGDTFWHVRDKKTG